MSERPRRKYEVTVAVIPYEVWTVEASSPEEAEENYASGICDPELEWSSGDVEVLGATLIEDEDGEGVSQ